MFDLLSAKKDNSPKTLADISVAVLAGGLGTRLRPVLSDRPKVMAEVRGRPFLTWWLDSLAQQGCREVVLCTGHLASQVSNWFGPQYGDIAIRYSVEPTPMGTGGALIQALPELTSPNILVLNGDSFCDVDFLRLRAEQSRRAARVMMVLTQAEDTSRFGRVEVQPDGRVLKFTEKGADSGPGWINAGIYSIDRELLTSLEPDRVVSLEKDLIPQWLSGGIFGFASVGRFIDIGTPESLIQAEDFFSSRTEAAA